VTTRNKSLLLALSAPLVAAICYVAFLYLSYISDEVTSGSAYGFRIGASKAEAYAMARAALGGKRVYILYPINEQFFGPHVAFHFSDGEYAMLSDRDFWKFYFDTEFSSSLDLLFDDGRLKRIYRHRQYFEFP